MHTANYEAWDSEWDWANEVDEGYLGESDSITLLKQLYGPGIAIWSNLTHDWVDE